MVLQLLFFYLDLRHQFSPVWWERWRSKRKLQELTYGELRSYCMPALLKQVPIDADTSFLDLGCGKGKLVFNTAVTHGIKSVGVDILPSYIKVAQRLSRFQAFRHCQFIQADFTQDTSWLKASEAKHRIVFFATTCLDQRSIDPIITLLLNQPGQLTLITTSQIIDHAKLKVLNSQKMPCSWGKVTVVTHVKTASS